MGVGIKRQYPHLPNIKDPDINGAIRIIFDKLYDHDATLKSQSDDISTAQDNITLQQKSLSGTQTLVNRISATGSVPVTKKGAISGGGSGGGGGIANDDGGTGEVGCTEAGDNGHPPAGLELTNETAGKIICGTGAEFPALLGPTVDQPSRDANMLEIINRMIWHLNQYGFTAVNRSSPAGDISKWMLGFYIAGIPYGYRVLGYEDFTQTMTTTMVQFGAEDLHPVPNGGIPD